MKAAHPGIQLSLTPKPRLTQHLSHTIQLSELLELNEEALYHYLAQAAEANPMLVLQRPAPGLFPMPTSGEGADISTLSASVEMELQDYLQEQLHFLSLSKQQRAAVRYLIEALDEDGFLREDLTQLAHASGFQPDELDNARSILQSLEPAGIGARDLRECLLLQLQRLPRRNRLAELLIQEHWELFLRNYEPQKLAALLGVSDRAASEACKCIAGLNPHPANGFVSSRTQYITPDAYLVREESAFRVHLPQSYTLSIDASYPALFADMQDKQVQSFLARCARQAEQLVSSLSYRNALFQKILLLVVQHQADFLSGGEKKPLLQKDVASLLGVNTSTISRAISGKYLSVDGHCVAVRELFSRRSACDYTRSSDSIHRQIAALIAREDPAKPLSDQKLSEVLARSGLNISRRLIAKYRMLANIPPAYARKNHCQSIGRGGASARGEKE